MLERDNLTAACTSGTEDLLRRSFVRWDCGICGWKSSVCLHAEGVSFNLPHVMYWQPLDTKQQKKVSIVPSIGGHELPAMCKRRMCARGTAISEIPQTKLFVVVLGP